MFLNQAMVGWDGLSATDNPKCQSSHAEAKDRPFEYLRHSHILEVSHA
jgi:hypothetical protein